MADNLSVDMEMMESVQDDAAQAPEGVDALSEALAAGKDTTAGDDQTAVEEPAGEPESKALKGRMKAYEQRGYKRAMQEAESKWAEEKRVMQERLAKLDRMELEAEAKEFAQKNNVPEEFAKDYLRMKKGLPGESAQPRDNDGRFEAAQPRQEAARSESQERAQMLMVQAEVFEKATGGAVSKDQILEAFQNDPGARTKVISGEWDFADIGRSLMAGGGSQAPRVTRSANNGRIQNSSIRSMSDAEFARLNDRIAKGEVFDARR